MSTVANTLRQLFSFILPITVLIIVPDVLLSSWSVQAQLWLIPGIIFGLTGLLLMVSTIRLFMTRGRGTLAPWSPTRVLVVSGPYAYVRNPMISGVFFVLLGETFTYASWHLAAWAFSFLVINHIFFLVYEEPSLRARFGSAYDEYCRAVPRWRPRIKPYRVL